MDQLLQSAINAINDGADDVAPQHLGFFGEPAIQADLELANLTVRSAEPLLPPQETEAFQRY